TLEQTSVDREDHVLKFQHHHEPRAVSWSLATTCWRRPMSGGLSLIGTPPSHAYSARGHKLESQCKPCNSIADHDIVVYHSVMMVSAFPKCARSSAGQSAWLRTRRSGVRSPPGVLLTCLTPVLLLLRSRDSL